MFRKAADRDIKKKRRIVGGGYGVESELHSWCSRLRSRGTSSFTCQLCGVGNYRNRDDVL